MVIKWSFNRSKHEHSIPSEEIVWKGPYCLPNYGSCEKFPDISGVYLWCFELFDGYVLESVGETNSTKKRINSHIRNYKNGNYNILCMDRLKTCEREEIWHGWAEAKKIENKQNFKENFQYYSDCIDRQLSNSRIFIAEIDDKRKRQRLEAALILNYYCSKDPWSDLISRWMYTRGRFNSELPIEINNILEKNIFNFPVNIEI